MVVYHLSTNNGKSWKSTNVNNTSIYCLAVSDTNIFAGGDGGGVYLSTKGDSIWHAVKIASTVDVVRALAVSGSMLFAGTDGAGVFLSTNNGTSWSNVTGGFTGDDATVQALAVSGTKLFAGTANGVFVSTNDGTSWSSMSSGLTDDDVVALGVAGTKLFAGTTSKGVFVSTNDGASWTQASTGLTNLRVSAFAISDSNLFAGTYAGVWRQPLSEIIASVGSPSAIRPKQFNLGQNYPNPFNPTTTISFDLPIRSFVSVKVFDIAGRKVSTIVSGELQAGSYSRQWNAANMASGVYFYRLQAGTYSVTKKLLLLK